MKQIYFPDKEDVYIAIAKHMSDEIGKIASTQETVTVAVPGGRSAAGVFAALLKENIDWSVVRLFMVDERLVLFEDDEGYLHDDLNYKILEEELIGPLEFEGKLDRKHVHPFKFLKEEDDAGLGDYEEELLQEKGRFDIVFVSAGEDGHIAALFPNHHSIENDSLFFIDMKDSPKEPPLRMSASRKLILGAQAAFILFVGDSKQEAYDRFKDDNVAIQDCPAKIVRYIPECYVGTDLE